jgi:hypothetical protein
MPNLSMGMQGICIVLHFLVVCGPAFAVRHRSDTLLKYSLSNTYRDAQTYL